MLTLQHSICTKFFLERNRLCCKPQQSEEVGTQLTFVTTKTYISKSTLSRCEGRLAILGGVFICQTSAMRMMNLKKTGQQILVMLLKSVLLILLFHLVPNGKEPRNSVPALLLTRLNGALI